MKIKNEQREFWGLMDSLSAFLESDVFKENDPVFALTKRQTRILLQWAETSIQLSPLISAIKEKIDE